MRQDLRQNILQTAINTYGIPAQEDMMLEEMSELTKAILKLRRLDDSLKNKIAGDMVKTHIIEEMADVQIMLDQMRIIYGDTFDFEKCKLERLADRLGMEAEE